MIQLATTIEKICENSKGILAADESTSTIAKRLADINVESTEQARQAYRELLFTTPHLSDYCCGVILFEETLYQSSSQGVPFVKMLQDQGVLPGIKVDLGLVHLALSQDEQVTQGMDSLVERLAKYKEQGACFAKWRSVYKISEVLPSKASLAANAELLARYAAICQEQQIVPIVEPEVLMDGDHTIERCAEVTREVLISVFAALACHNVALEHIILKPNMVVPGSQCSEQADAQTVADMTLELLKEHVPALVPTVNFLSGGQRDVDATLHLQLMNAAGDLPWNLSYSYGRALQAPALQAWQGKPEQVVAGQQALFKRLKLNSAAVLGEYQSSMED